MATISEATWIWYPGDYEIWLGNRMNNRRTERGAFFPPFWKMDSHYVTVEFSKELDLPEAETIDIAAEGTFNIKLDGKLQFGMPEKFLLPAGRHKLNIKVWNQATPPAIYIIGKTVRTDSTWRVTYEDKEWIDESGKASDTSATLYADAGCWCFNDIDTRPSQFKLSRTPQEAVSRKAVDGGVLYDFGKETFGYAVLKGVTGEGVIHLYYGESAEEATDKAYCETLDAIAVDGDTLTDLAQNKTAARQADYTLGNSKAFRYVFVTTEGTAAVADLAMEYEYLPVNYRGSFSCDDEELNDMWKVGAYTMHLTTREFFIDGIKRDRWVWSGDAIQSYLMNYYLFFDSETVKRTIWLLRGKDPVTSHINTIMDYTFYWVISVYGYYLYTGDKHFVKQIYPRMKSMMDYVGGRTNGQQMVEGLEGDWVFVDWADFPMDKKGALAFEQILYCKSQEVMRDCARLLNLPDDETYYADRAKRLRENIMTSFWKEERHAFIHNIGGSDAPSTEINKFPNMFALTLGYLSDAQKKAVMEHVMLNEAVPQITTPYMRFYELEAMCEMGYQTQVLKEMKAYWGGMLKEGATSFWEKYNPEEQGRQHLAMYGRPYGKSLCHAWGASPIYLLGKYYLGVKPVKPGYEEFEIRPVLGGLAWMKGSVPTPNGVIDVYMDTREIRVKATEGQGFLYVKATSQPKASAGTFEEMHDGTYRLWIATHEEIKITY